MQSKYIQNYNEEEVIDLFRQGEEKSLEYIIRRFQKELVFFASNIIQKKEVAEEIVDDSFLKVWLRHSDFNALSALKSFLYISVKNACLDYLKSPKNKPLENISDFDGDLSSSDNIEANMIYAELLGLIFREAELLPEKQKQVFLLSYIEGLTTAEIADRLGISPNAVFINKHESTKAMRKVLGTTFWLLYFMLKV